MEATTRPEIPPGSLYMLILKTLARLGSMHGYGIAQHIDRCSHGVFQVEKGSLYPALERLLRNGLVTSKWAETPTGRRAKYYTITASGRRALGAEISAFQELYAAIVA
ncbi:MAG: PadR family transcriptional regulator, partial [Acidobacteriota bacterium]|nr:PadR family transcriptional regulator [Acidobacteriota bacterium]